VKRRKLVAAVAAAAVAIAVLSTGVATARVRHQTPGIENGEITVAGLGPDNPYKQFGADTGAKARFAQFNDNNEIKGLKIKYLGWTDDGNSADTNLQQTQKLIQQDQVFALVPVATPWYLEGGKFAEQQKVSAFGWGISTSFCTSKFAFGFTGCLVPPPGAKTSSELWAGLIDQYFKNKGDAKGAKGKTAAVISEDNDSGKSGVITIATGAKRLGMKVVYAEASMPAAEGGTPVSDFTPFVNDILTSNNGGQPDVVFSTISQNNLLGFAPALENAGFTGLDTNAVLYSPLAAAIMKDNQVLVQSATPEAAPDVPAVQDFVDAVNKVAPGEVIQQPTIAGYLSADMFIAALKKAGKNPTRETVQAAAAKMTYKIDGFVGPTTFPRAFTIGTPCGELVGSDGTTWTISAPLHCYKNFNTKTGKTIK
jgi:ABC-type branched-subunit amino acid transport system substrate-binding protein